MDQWEGDSERHHGSSGQDSRTTVLTRKGVLPSGVFLSVTKMSKQCEFSLVLLRVGVIFLGNPPSEGLHLSTCDSELLLSFQFLIIHVLSTCVINVKWTCQILQDFSINICYYYFYLQQLLPSWWSSSWGNNRFCLHFSVMSTTKL